MSTFHSPTELDEEIVPKCVGAVGIFDPLLKPSMSRHFVTRRSPLLLATTWLRRREYE